MLAYWIIYSVYCFVHLLFSFLEKEKPRKITKLLIMPLLILGLFLFDVKNYFIYLGLLFGWIGDIYLLNNKERKYFVIGTICFIFGHIAYILEVMRLYIIDYGLTDQLIHFLLIILIIAIIILLFAYFKMKRKLGKLAYLGSTYFSILISGFVLSFLLQKPLLSIGFGFFIISDILISVFRFYKKTKRSHFYIMITYLLAQTLIALSFIL